MKTNTFKQFLVLGAIMLCQNTFAQLPSIDSLKLIPQNPTATDEIKVICYATFASGSCNMSNHLISVQGNQITLNINYSPGAATYICHAVDTVSLGNLSAGDYSLDTYLTIDPMDAIKDYVILNFTVGNALGIGDNSSSFQVSVQPNPFSNELYIETTARIEKAEVNAISGQKIRKEIPLGYSQKIDLSDLKDGVYLLTLTDQNGNRYSKRIVKKSL